MAKGQAVKNIKNKLCTKIKRIVRFSVVKIFEINVFYIFKALDA